MASPSPEIKAQLLREEALEALAKAHVSILVVLYYSFYSDLCALHCTYEIMPMPFVFV